MGRFPMEKTGRSVSLRPPNQQASRLRILKQSGNTPKVKKGNFTGLLKPELDRKLLIIILKAAARYRFRSNPKGRKWGEIPLVYYSTAT